MIHQGDALTVLRTLPEESVDAVVTDPPYGERNASWDTPKSIDWWRKYWPYKVWCDEVCGRAPRLGDGVLCESCRERNNAPRRTGRPVGRPRKYPIPFYPLLRVA